MVKSMEYDYSDLNTALKTKMHIEWITDWISKQIWELFLTNTRSKDKNQNNIDSLAKHLENISEAAKTEFLIKVQYLIDNNFLKAGSIKTIKIKDLEKKEPDEKLNFIINQLIDKAGLNDDQKKALAAHTTKALTNVYKTATDVIVDNQKLQEKVNNLENDNEDLQSEIDAMEGWFETAEDAILQRRRFVNKYRMIWNKIKQIVDKEWINSTNFNRILQNANLVTHNLPWRLFHQVIHLRWKDVHDNYKNVVDNLKTMISDNETNAETKIAIHYIMKQLNVAYEQYIEATVVNKEQRKQNMKDIYKWMAA